MRKKQSEINFETIEESSLYINSKVADNLGITVPDEMKESAAEVFDTIDK